MLYVYVHCVVSISSPRFTGCLNVLIEFRRNQTDRRSLMNMMRLISASNTSSSSANSFAAILHGFQKFPGTTSTIYIKLLIQLSETGKHRWGIASYSISIKWCLFRYEGIMCKNIDCFQIFRHNWLFHWNEQSTEREVFIAGKRERGKRGSIEDWREQRVITMKHKRGIIPGPSPPYIPLKIGCHWVVET